MTLHHNSPAHRQLKARQKKPFLFPGIGDPTGDPTDTTSATTPTAPSSSPTPPPPPPTTSKTHKPTPTPSSSPPPPPPPPSSTSTSKSAAATSTQSHSTSSESHSESKTESSTSATTTISSKTTGAGAVTITGTPKTLTQTSTFGSFTSTSTDDSFASISASATPTASSGMSTGAIVGSVAGGIVAIAFIGLIIAFFLRRWRRNRITDEDFNQDEFVRTPNMSDTGYRASTFDPVPPSMAHRGHNVSPSMGSTNMAGQGAFPYNGGAAVQERQQYSYGQGYEPNGFRDDDEGEIAHGGAYSSEPQAQAPYNAEAYGSYAYSTEGQHAAMPQSYGHPYSAQEYQAHYQDNASPALVAGAPAVAAGRGAHVVDHNDAYG
ncbi:hypothetical protein FPV67DRAFT_1476397, partial [Lyophyllum atratum]